MKEERATDNNRVDLSYCVGRFYRCLARRRGRVKFGASAARATDTSGIGSFMGTLRDDHRGRYSVSQRGHPLE